MRRDALRRSQTETDLVSASHPQHPPSPFPSLSQPSFLRILFLHSFSPSTRNDFYSGPSSSSSSLLPSLLPALACFPFPRAQCFALFPSPCLRLSPFHPPRLKPPRSSRVLARVPNGSPRGSFVSHRQLRDAQIVRSAVKDPLPLPASSALLGIERINGDDEVLSDWLVAGNATSVKASDRDPRGVDVKGRRDTFTGKGWNGIRRCIAIGCLEFHVRITFVRNVCVYVYVCVSCVCVRERKREY